MILGSSLAAALIVGGLLVAKSGWSDYMDALERDERQVSRGREVGARD